MGNDSSPHLSLNLRFNLKTKMQKRKSRSEIGLLNNTLGQDPDEEPPAAGEEGLGALYGQAAPQAHHGPAQ